MINIMSATYWSKTPKKKKKNYSSGTLWHEALEEGIHLVDRS